MVLLIVELFVTIKHFGLYIDIECCIIGIISILK